MNFQTLELLLGLLKTSEDHEVAGLSDAVLQHIEQARGGGTTASKDNDVDTSLTEESSAFNTPDQDNSEGKLLEQAFQHLSMVPDEDQHRDAKLNPKQASLWEVLRRSHGYE